VHTVWSYRGGVAWICPINARAGMGIVAMEVDGGKVEVGGTVPLERDHSLEQMAKGMNVYL